jgi:hypothetical protein
MAKKAKTNKRRKWVPVVVAAALIIDLLFVGYLVYVLWGRMFSSAEAPTSPASAQAPLELWDAYRQAQAAAQAQARDAQLVSASTQWSAVSEQALLDGTNNWSFVFYSPANGDSVDVVVNAGTAQVVNQTQVWAAPSVLAGKSWQSGPREALLTFLAYGGRAFLDGHPQATVDVHLAEGDEGGAVWTIVALDPEDRSLFSLLIDAETRQVLSG